MLFVRGEFQLMIAHNANIDCEVGDSVVLISPGVPF